MSGAVVLTGIAAAAGAVALADTLHLFRAARARRPSRAERTSRRGPLLALVAGLGRRVAAGRRAPGGGLAARLDAAGRPLGLSPADLAALKAGSGLVCLGLAVVWGQALPGRLGIAALLAMPVAGFWLPDALLVRRAAERRRVLEREVADVLDLLRVAVGAGRAPDRALHDVALYRGGLLGAELGRAAEQVELGVPRERAFASLAARCPLEPVAALVAALGRADRHGAPLDEALTSLAAQARADRARLAQEAGARAAPQIQLIVALVLVPAVMLLVAASLVRGLT
ncbi:MAG: type II secretion system F family protein [Solirubrobacteraceae bacterium]|nr:type II secretion system F family protein [Solirubrobacteraceae bacterium]